MSVGRRRGDFARAPQTFRRAAIGAAFHPNWLLPFFSEEKEGRFTVSLCLPLCGMPLWHVQAWRGARALLPRPSAFATELLHAHALTPLPASTYHTHRLHRGATLPRWRNFLLRAHAHAPLLFSSPLLLSRAWVYRMCAAHAVACMFTADLLSPAYFLLFPSQSPGRSVAPWRHATP